MCFAKIHRKQEGFVSSSKCTRNKQSFSQHRGNCDFSFSREFSYLFCLGYHFARIEQTRRGRPRRPEIRFPSHTVTRPVESPADTKPSRKINSRAELSSSIALISAYRRVESSVCGKLAQSPFAPSPFSRLYSRLRFLFLSHSST